MIFVKKFFNSTILGLALGILLMGYAVFAFQAPTQAPPAGNTPIPVNVGAGDQIKSGGLWVKNLVVDGSIKTGSFTSLPTCDTPRKGSLVFNTNINKISICTGTAWEVFSTGIDFDGDGVIAGTDCNDGDINIWQNLACYIDNDSDGTRSTFTTTACSGASCSGSTGSLGTDCDGWNPNIFQNLGNMVTDADNDGHPTATAAAIQCVGTSSTINTRTYYKNASGFFTWCSNTVCTKGTDSNDTVVNPSPKTCDTLGPACGSDVRAITPGGLDAACAAYCGSFIPSRSCTFSYPCGGAGCVQNPNTCTSFNFSTCTGSNRANQSDGTPLCRVSPAYTVTNEDGSVAYIVPANTTTCTCN